jgi:hypothetical protein
MIGDLMLYGTAVAFLFGLAGIALERIAIWRRVPRRGVWGATLVLSVVFPIVAILLPLSRNYSDSFPTPVDSHFY